MVPEFTEAGLLPPGIHDASWHEVQRQFGFNSHRRDLLVGLAFALANLRRAGCNRVWLDGSFVTTKEYPNDYDACWDPVRVQPALLDPVFLDFRNSRRAQKRKYGGEFFPVSMIESQSQTRFLDFFQMDRLTGQRKGIVKLSRLDTGKP